MLISAQPAAPCGPMSNSSVVGVHHPLLVPRDELPVLGNLDQVLPPLSSGNRELLADNASDSTVSQSIGGRISPDSSMDWNGNAEPVDVKKLGLMSQVGHTPLQPDSTWQGSNGSPPPSPAMGGGGAVNYDSDAFDSDASDASYLELERNPNLIAEILASAHPAIRSESNGPVERESGLAAAAAAEEEAAAGKRKTKKTKKKKVKRAGDVVLQCSQCDYSTRFKEHLTSHMNTHNERRNFMCSDCGQTFKWSHSLKRHQRTHQSNFKRFSCSFCFKEFSRKDHLTIHENLHRTSSASFPCAVCGASFKNKKTLAGHIKTHNSEREFACDQCDSSFTRRSSLTRHFDRVHAGKTIQCHLCPATFSYRSTLEDHKKAAHNEGKRDFACNICGAQFAVKAYLSKHRVSSRRF